MPESLYQWALWLLFHLSSLVLHKITRNIFEAIVEQAPMAIEDLMNELDTQSGEGEATDGDDESSEDEQDLGDSPPKKLCAGEELWAILGSAQGSCWVGLAVS